MAANGTRTVNTNGQMEAADDRTPSLVGKLNGMNGKLSGVNNHAQERHSENESVLHITDSRTGVSYDIPIWHNSVRALDFKAIKVPDEGNQANQADDADGGLRLLDPGFQNTAVKESEITFV